MFFNTPSRIFVLIMFFILGLICFIKGLIENEENQYFVGAAIMTAYILVPLINYLN